MSIEIFGFFKYKISHIISPDAEFLAAFNMRVSASIIRLINYWYRPTLDDSLSKAEN
jgi:hypothetical protein